MPRKVNVIGVGMVPFAKPGKKLQPGDCLRFGNATKTCLLGNLDAIVEEKGEAGEITLAFDFSGPVLARIWSLAVLVGAGMAVFFSVAYVVGALDPDLVAMLRRRRPKRDDRDDDILEVQ